MSVASISITRTRVTLEPARIVLLAVAAFVVLAPSTHLIPQLGKHDSQRVIEIALLVGTAGLILFHAQTRESVARMYASVPRPVGVLSLTLFAIGLASSAFSARPLYALLEVGHLVLLVLLAALVAAECRRSENRFVSILIGTLLLGIGIYIFRVVMSFAGHIGFGFPAWPEANVGFIHPRYFNQLQTWTLPLVAFASLHFSRQGRLPRIATMAALAIWWSLLFASGGRGAFLGTVVGLAAVALLYRRRSLPLVRIYLIAAPLGFAAFLVIFKWLGVAGASILDRGLGDTGRLGLWEAAIQMMQSNPVFGVGPMHFAHAEALAAAHPHNAFLQLGSEWGVPALAIGVTLVVLVARSLWRDRNEYAPASETDAQGHLRMALVAALTAGLAHGMLSGMFVTPLSQMMAALLAGALWGLVPVGLRRGTKTFVPAATRVVPFVAGLALVLTTLGVSRDLLVLNQRERALLEHRLHVAGETGARGVLMTPRFWQQGWIGSGSDVHAASTKLVQNNSQSE